VKIAVNDIWLKTRGFGLHLCRRKFRYIFNHLYAVHAKSYWIRWNNATTVTPFKVIQDFGTNRKVICDFLLVINTNLPPILHHFRDIAFDKAKIPIFGYPSCV